VKEVLKRALKHVKARILTLESYGIDIVVDVPVIFWRICDVLYYTAHNYKSYKVRVN